MYTALRALLANSVNARHSQNQTSAEMSAFDTIARFFTSWPFIVAVPATIPSASFRIVVMKIDKLSQMSLGLLFFGSSLLRARSTRTDSLFQPFP